MNNIKLPPLPAADLSGPPGTGAYFSGYTASTVRKLLKEACAERDKRIAELESQLAGGQEPVAWTILFDGHYVGNNFTYEKLAVEKMRALNISHPNEARCVVPLYLHPTEPLSDEQAADAAKYRALNTPEIADFIVAIEREALYQRDRWGADGDAGKTDADWFWLIGYLAGKAMNPAASNEKRLHHIITTAAACLNWHGARVGAYTDMRPDITGDKP